MPYKDDRNNVELKNKTAANDRASVEAYLRTDRYLGDANALKFLARDRVFQAPNNIRFVTFAMVDTRTQNTRVRTPQDWYTNQAYFAAERYNDQQYNCFRYIWMLNVNNVHWKILGTANKVAELRADATTVQSLLAINPNSKRNRI